MQKRVMETYPGEVQSQTPLSLTDGEIGMADLWRIVGRRWPWLLAGVVSGAVLAVGYVASMPSLYEARALVQVGKIFEVGPIEDPGAVVVQLMDQYGSGSADVSRKGLPRLKQVTETPGKSGVLKLVAVGSTPQETQQFLTDVAAKLTQQHEQIYSETVGPQQSRIAMIDGQIEQLKTERQELGKLIARLKESRPTEAMLIALERSRLSMELGQLERDRLALQRQVVPPYSRPSKLLERPTLPETAAKPTLLRSVAVGAVVGLILTLLLVFFIERTSRIRVGKL